MYLLDCGCGKPLLWKKERPQRTASSPTPGDRSMKVSSLQNRMESVCGALCPRFRAALALTSEGGERGARVWVLHCYP